MESTTMMTPRVKPVFFVELNPALGKIYAGSFIPKDSKVIGTVKRLSGEIGALLSLPSGHCVQYNAGVIKSLPMTKGSIEGVKV